MADTRGGFGSFGFPSKSHAGRAHQRGLATCATASPPKDAHNVAVIERNKEGETHLALPTVLPGCEHLGMTRVSIPEGVPGLPLEILNTLKQKAANMGGGLAHAYE